MKQFRAYIPHILAVLLGLTVVAGAKADDAAQLNDRGIEAYRNGDFEASVQAFTDALVERPDVPELSFNRGTALAAGGNFDEAVTELERAALAFTDSGRTAAAYFNAGNTFLASSKLDEAIMQYKRAVKLDQTSEDIRHNLELALRMKDQQQDQQNQQQEQQQQDQQDQEDQQQDQQNQPDESQENQQQGQEQQQQTSQEEMQQLSEEDARRILDAIADEEQDALDQRRLLLQQEMRRGNDW